MGDRDLGIGKIFHSFQEEPRHMNSHVGKLPTIGWIERIPGYHYNDTPEGQDCLKKVIYMNKLGFVCGAAFSTLDIIAVSKPVGIPAIAARYAFLTFPIMAVGSTFAATTCTLTAYRGKDDKFNHLWGGFSAGCVAGAICRSGTFGTAAALLLAAFAYFKKEVNDEGINLFAPAPPHSLGNIWAIKNYNTSMYEDLPRGWKKSADEVLPK